MLDLFSQEWAEAAAQAINDGPTDEERAEKIDRYWDWIEQAKGKLDCVWGLGRKDDGAGKPAAVLFRLEAGRCTEARAVDLNSAHQQADYLLLGSNADWHDLQNGYHTGKAVMYRKLVLAEGEVLLFFRSAFFWTEALAHMQRVPTRC